MRKIFVISDTHFCHENILKFKDGAGMHFRGRKFSDVYDMNEYMIDRWNKTVSNEDIIYHLGDVYMGREDMANEILSRLNGAKRLILGNHDKGKDKVLHKHFQKIMMWRMFPEFNCVLSHVPVHEGSLFKVKYNVHGHIHEKVISDSRYINVSVEQIDYTPILLERLTK